MGWAIASNRVRGLERQQKRRGGYVENADSYSFTIAPTCPPSTSVVFRGGLVWWPSSAIFPFCYFMPSYTVDLADSDKISVRLAYQNYNYIFTNAYWYVPAMLVLSSYGLDYHDEWPDDIPEDSIYLAGTTRVAPYMEEFETAAEAENRMGANEQLDASRQYGFVTTSIILRNNGDTESPNAWMPIDLINRGRSYLFRSCVPGWEAQ